MSGEHASLGTGINPVTAAWTTESACAELCAQQLGYLGFSAGNTGAVLLLKTSCTQLCWKAFLPA